MRHAVVAGQWLVLAAYVLPGEVLREWNGGLPDLSATTAAAAATIQQAFGPPAWILLALLGVIAVAGLWDRWGWADLIAALLTAATVPCLLAGPFLADRAAASMLRWGLAVAFVIVSTAVWQRHRLAALARRPAHALPSGRTGRRSLAWCCWQPRRCRLWD